MVSLEESVRLLVIFEGHGPCFVPFFEDKGEGPEKLLSFAGDTGSGPDVLRVCVEVPDMFLEGVVREVVVHDFGGESCSFEERSGCPIHCLEDVIPCKGFGDRVGGGEELEGGIHK